MSLHTDHVLGHVPSFTTILLISCLLRVALIIYSEWHDAHSIVKYTDVDYRVFSDAARFILNPTAENRADGPLAGLLNVGSPYTRATYRYTPLLAVLLAPNEWLHPSFGKFLFAACDIAAGVLMYELLVSIILPSTRPSSVDGGGETSTKEGERPDGRSDASAIRQRATFLVSLHLLSPLVFTISTRGSSESVLSLFVLGTLYCALRGRWDAAAVLLGLSTHWKIYPFVYGVSCLGVIGRERVGGTRGGVAGWARSVVNARTARFALISGGTFVALGAAMYALWGQPFLEESYLYHLHRLDHRHNFSPYFYLVYLTYPTTPSLPEVSGLKQLLRSPLTSFVPQMALALGSGLLFGRRKADLAFAWFVQTFVFVVFNKVCTSQYFLWYTLFLPLLIPRLSMSPRRALAYGGVWIGTQALWLAEAYKLEFLGENVFFALWVRSLIYVVGNCWVLSGLMDAYAQQ